MSTPSRAVQAAHREARVAAAAASLDFTPESLSGQPPTLLRRRLSCKEKRSEPLLSKHKAVRIFGDGKVVTVVSTLPFLSGEDSLSGKGTSPRTRL
jgi:hypothetical protein